MPGPSERVTADEPSLDLRRYLRVVWKRRWSCAAVVVVAFVSAVIFTANQTPVFQAAATVLIEPQAPKVVTNFQDMVPVIASEEYYATQFKLIQTRAVIERAIERLRLKERIPWLAEIKDPYWVIAGSVSVEPIKNTQLVQVKFADPDPRLAADIANGIANEYVNYNLETKHKVAQEALVWLNEQLASLRTQTQQSSKALQAYQARADLLGLKEQGAIAQSKLLDGNKAYLVAQNERLAIEVKLRELSRLAQDPRAAETVQSIVNDPLVQKLKTEAFDLQTERVKLTQLFKEKHPDIQALDSQIKQVHQRLQAEIQKMHRSVETELKVARAREETLLANLNELKREARRLSEREGQALGLEWEKESNTELHGVVLKRLKETGVAAVLEASNVRVVEAATTPNFPIRPRKTFIWSLSIVAGLALGVGMAFLADSLDNRVRSREDIERLGLPILGIVPIFDTGRRPQAVESRS
jgi:succinoglycan biosynthesis transport protein ExoP